MASWSDLPENVLQHIRQKIDAPIDLLSFAAVCKRWRSKSPHCVPQDFPVQNYPQFPKNFPKESPFPMLLVPFGRNDLGKRPYLYNIIDRKAYSSFSESIFHDKWIPGSTRGWLVTVDTLDKSINLLNPLTTRQIALPAQSTFDKPALEEFRPKVEDAWVGDNKWTNVNRSPVGICDIINIKGILWAVNRSCELFAIVIGRRRTKLTVIVGRCPRVMPFGCSQTYLVESCGGLLMVCRDTTSIDDEGQAQTDEVWDFAMAKSVSKYLTTYEVENRSLRRNIEVQYEWVEVESVGKQMIFLGYNHSLSLDPRAYPGCHGDRVYFADHLFNPDMSRFFFGCRHNNYHDIGVYHLRNERIEFLEGLGSCLLLIHYGFLPPPGSCFM